MTLHSPVTSAFLRRVRRRAIVRVVLWAIAVIATAVALAALLHATRPSRLAASGSAGLFVPAVTGLAWLCHRHLRPWTGARTAATTEALVPAFRNTLVTASELMRGPSSWPAYTLARLRDDVEGFVRRTSPATIVPLRQPVQLAGVAVVLAAIALWWVVRVGPAAEPALGAASMSANRSATTPPALGPVQIELRPPAYTRLPSRTVSDPGALDALEGTRIRVSVTTSSPRVAFVDEAGHESPMPVDAGGVAHIEHTPQRSGVLTVVAFDGLVRRVVPLTLRGDAPPTVRINAPGRDLTFERAAGVVAVRLDALDDWGLASLSVRVTKVSGTGENFTFDEMERPYRLTRDDTRHWHGALELPLAEFGLEAGDQLVYRAVARDIRPEAPPATSDAYIIRIAARGASTAEGFSLPEERDAMALSQQVVIQLTERLRARRASVSAAEYAEESLGLAAAQRRVRAEFVFLMGGEVADEEEEAAHAHDLVEGRLENRGARDLLEATREMSRAEALLTGAKLDDALAAERLALAALQRAFDRRRYIVRTIAGRTAIDPARRLSGDVREAQPQPRHVEPPRRDRTVEELRGVLADLAGLASSDTPPMAAERAVERLLRAEAPNDELREMASAWLSCRARRSARAVVASGGVGGAEPCGAELSAVARAVQDGLALRLGTRRGDPPAADRALAGALADARRRRQP